MRFTKPKCNFGDRLRSPDPLRPSPRVCRFVHRGVLHLARAARRPAARFAHPDEVIAGWLFHFAPRNAIRKHRGRDLPDTIASSPVGIRMLDDLVCEGFASARPLTDLSEAALYELVVGAAVEISRRSGRRRGRPVSGPGRRTCAGRRGRPTRQRCPAKLSEARWWSGGVFDRAQVWLQFRSMRILWAGNRIRVCREGTDADLDFVGACWARRRVVAVMKDGADGPPPDRPNSSIWRLTPFPRARVFEIRTPADCRWFCRDPSRPGRLGNVAFLRLGSGGREHFDGITSPSRDSSACRASRSTPAAARRCSKAWDAESTAWLHWAVDRSNGTAPWNRSTPPSEVTARRRFRRTRRR